MARELKPCGTPAAARRHRRNGEPLCDECEQAVRDEKNGRKDAERAEGVESVQGVEVAHSGHMSRLEVLQEVLDTLRQHMQASAPQNIAPIAAQIRAVSAEIADLTGESKPKPESAESVFDELAQMRSKRVS